MDRLQRLTESAGLERMLSVKVGLYAVLALAAVALVVKILNDKRGRSRTWLTSRPRSPDPEKTSTNINDFVEKRTKPTERPPG
ncbi:hypothetical protein LTR33_017988, partial [Friedmanniomyces endolithicus]